MSGFGYNVLGFGANASGGGEVLPSDDQFNRVSFLSHFDGANNGVNNAFDDGSTSNHTITAAGNATQGSFGPFARPDGEWAVNLGSSTNTLRAVGAGDISGDFTVETWVFMNNDNGNYIHLTYNSGGIVNVFNVYNGSVQNFLFGTSSTAGQTTLEFNDTTWDAGVWTHLAMVRSSGTLKIYVNGVADATTSTAVSGNLTDLEYIGTGRSFTSDARIFDGKVSNVRFSSTARYTSNFTPPTAPFTADSDTNLLTCQSNRFVDNSSNGYTVTPGGNPAVTAFGPFLSSKVYNPAVNGASAFIAAQADGINIADSSEFNMTGEFSVEFWVYLISNDAGGIDIMFRGYGNGQNTQIGYEPSNRHLYLYNDANPVTSSTDMHIKSWNHVVCCRTSSTTSIFLNGVRVGTNSSYSTAVDWGGGTTQFMAYGTGEYSPAGYGTDLRLLKGSSAYDATASTLTVPTAPLTAITNTKLLLNMADGQAVDSAAQNNLTLAGTAKTSTAQQKFGTASILFDGNSDYAYTTVSTPIGAGDYTVECFVYFNTLKYSGVYQFDNVVLGSQAYHGPVIFIGTSSPFYWATMTQHGSNQSIYSTTSPSANQWYHVANVRTNGVVKIFVDGTQIIDNFADTTDYSARNKLTLGGFYSSTYYFDGYIDEFRVSQFARYTSNFTAPTAAFADKGQ